MDHHRHNHQHHHRHNHHQPHTMYPTNSTQYPTHPHMISTPNYTPTPTPTTPTAANNHRFPFNTPPLKLEPQSSPYSGSVSADGYEIDPNSQKKKRGRPRKYSPDNNLNNSNNGIDLGLSPTSIPPSGLADNLLKKNRGRPSGSSKRQLDALGNCGVGFTPHVIFVNAGEDIASKIVAFSKEGARTTCVLSANGSVCNVDLRQPAMSGGVIKYEGQFEIISLSGSFVFSENSGGQVRTGGLNVSLACTDGRVLGGGVVGVLRAATPIQIVVGSFIADGKKPKCMPSGIHPRTVNLSAQPIAAAENCPYSQEESTEGSDDDNNNNNNNNHFERDTDSYPNSNHNIHLYSQMSWPNPSSKMLHNN